PRRLLDGRRDEPRADPDPLGDRARSDPGHPARLRSDLPRPLGATVSAEDAPFAWTGRRALRSGTPYVVAEEAVRDRHILYIGATVALGMWIVAIFNAAGILSIQLRPGEGLRWNPAVDFFVLGLLALLGPYGVASAIRFHRVEGLESRLPDFLRDVAESGRFG
ncbi:conserved hypothetical protein, membrane, partial [mine drainage metagenome]